MYFVSYENLTSVKVTLRGGGRRALFRGVQLIYTCTRIKADHSIKISSHNEMIKE
jgi:hypothetical protein